MTANRVTLAVPTLFSLLLTLLLVASTTSAHAQSHGHTLSIAQARALPLGSVVSLEGTVSTPPGAFQSSFFDLGFGLQDRSAGIYVSVQDELGLAPRDRVTVTGVLAESFGLLILLPASPNDVDSCGKGPKVAARRVATAAVSESTEGSIVTVTGTVSQAPSSDLPYGYKLRADDGSGEVQIFINLQTGIDVSTLTIGSKLSITGFSSQFDDHYEIDPRSPADIVVRRP